MTDIVVDSIVSRRDFGTIFAGRLADGSSVRVKAANAAMLGMPSVGELWSVEGDLSDTQWGPQISAMLARASGRDEIADKVVSIWDELRDGRDVMIVTPVNDGPCGVSGLNRRLHDEYLRRKDLQELRGPLGDLFSPGEPLVHRRNCYKRGLFNGSMGIVRRIDRAERQLVAVFDDEEHVFASEDLVDLSLGYALTCHRAQGSEADYVIVALPQSRLLDPSWLYTAVTRARQQVIIVGQPETMKEALKRPYADKRRSVGLLW